MFGVELQMGAEMLMMFDVMLSFLGMILMSDTEVKEHYQQDPPGVCKRF